MSPNRQGQRRLFTREDVALALVLLRLRREGTSPIVSRVLVANWRDRMIEIWHAETPMAFGVTGMTDMVLRRGSRPESVVAWVDLLDVWRTVRRALPTEERKGNINPCGRSLRRIQGGR